MKAVQQRLDFHISDRVDRRQWYHWTLDFVRDNFAPKSAAMCLVGHIADDPDAYVTHERLLVLLKEEMLEDIFKIMSKLLSDHTLGQLEDCYLNFYTNKKKLLKSVRIDRDEMEACFCGCRKKMLQIQS